MKFKKGSAAAKAHMAKVRAAKVSGPKKKVSKNQLSIFDQVPTKKKAAPKKAAVKKAAPKKVVAKQKGSSIKKYDKLRQALPPGIRISQKTGKPYKEVRANRSDKGVLLGIGSYKNLSAGAKKIWIDTNKKGYFKFNTPKFIFLQLYEDALSKGQYKKAEYLYELYLFAEDDKY
jgi:hypothetical protein